MSRELAGAAADANMRNARDHCRSAVVSAADAWIGRDVGMMSQLQRILEVTRKYLQIERAMKEDSRRAGIPKHASTK